MGTLLETATEILGERPLVEDDMLHRMERSLSKRVATWKDKIQDGVTNNKEIIVIEDDIDVSHMARIKKRSKPSPPPVESPPTSTARRRPSASQNVSRQAPPASQAPPVSQAPPSSQAPLASQAPMSQVGPSLAPPPPSNPESNQQG